jgi:hypothetical protein
VRQPEDGYRDLGHGVAVGSRVQHRHGAERAARPRLVLDDDRLAEVLPGRLGERAHSDVGSPAGGPGDDHRDRLRGELLGGGAGGDRSRQRADDQAS